MEYLTKILLALRMRQNDSDEAFSKKMGISIRSWYYLKGGCSDVFRGSFRKVFDALGWTYKIFDKDGNELKP